MISDAPHAPAAPPPTLRAVTVKDIRDALAEGWRDFRAAPRYGLFFGAVYALGGLAMLALLTMTETPWMILPIAVGFPLVGPFVAVGVYEVSRRLETGEPLSWGAVLRAMWAQRSRQFAWMAFVVLFIFWIWMYQIRLLIALILGFKPFDSLGGFVATLFTTGDGLTFLAVGTLVGAALALILFACTVIAMPLLLERDLDFVTAIVASVRSVAENSPQMLLWGATVAAIALLSMLPAFLGLVVALPVLGHATWRLFRKAVVPLETAAA